jgi:hypothetical protein
MGKFTETMQGSEYLKLSLSDKKYAIMDAIDDSTWENSDLTSVLKNTPSIFFDICEYLFDVRPKPKEGLLKYIPSQATIPGVTPEMYTEWYQRNCNKIVSKDGSQIQYVTPDHSNWYHELCTKALLNKSTKVFDDKLLDLLEPMTGKRLFQFKGLQSKKTDPPFVQNFWERLYNRQKAKESGLFRHLTPFKTRYGLQDQLTQYIAGKNTRVKRRRTKRRV